MHELHNGVTVTSMTELRRDPTSLLAKVDGGRPVVLMRFGKPVAVLLAHAAYLRAVEGEDRDPA